MFNNSITHSLLLFKNTKWDIVKRIFEVQKVDPNFSDQETFIYLACINGEIGMVEFFLKLNRIDVNKYEYKSGKNAINWSYSE